MRVVVLVGAGLAACSNEGAPHVLDNGGGRIAFGTDFVESGTAFLDRDVIDGPTRFDAEGDPLLGPWAVYVDETSHEVVGWYYSGVGFVPVGTPLAEAAEIHPDAAASVGVSAP